MSFGRFSWRYILLLLSLYATGAKEVEEEEENYPPRILLSLIGDDGRPRAPPLTHMLEIETQSFDPAEGYLEVWSGSNMLRRILDPPPLDIFKVYLSASSCEGAGRVCHGMYTVKLFSFASNLEVTTSHIGYMLQGIEAEVKSERMKAAVNETSSPEEGWDVDFLKEAWPLPCKKIVTFPGFPDPAAYLQRPQIFLAVPPHDLGWMHFDPREVLRCQTPCLWLLELSCMDAADVLIFSCWWSQGRQGGGKPNVPKHPHQLWMNLCLESTGGREDKEFLHAMDISATYQLHSDIPLLYAPGNLSLFDRSESVTRDRFAMFVISHCGLARDVYLRQLMKYIPVDSFGKCLNNARLPSTVEYEASDKNPISPLVPLMKQYKFVLCFENSIQTDYVTEKFYIPLMAGAVPVYKGAPNIRQFSPDDHSFINVDDFDGPEELASYLTALLQDPVRYDEYHAWRRRPWTSQFLNISAMAFNQGQIYNEGAVHGTAQRISPVRVTDGIIRKLRGEGKHKSAEGLLDLNASWVRRLSRPALVHPSLALAIIQPAEGQEIPSSLLAGIELKVSVVQSGHIQEEDFRDNHMQVAVILDGRVFSHLEVNPQAPQIRSIVLEGVKNGPHTVQLGILKDEHSQYDSDVSWENVSGAVSFRVWRSLESKCDSSDRNDSLLHKYLDGCLDGMEAFTSGDGDEGKSCCKCFSRDGNMGGHVAFINLERRPDRLEHVRLELRRAGILNFTRVPAADGRLLDPSHQSLQWLFRRNHFGSDPAVEACAISHLRMWRTMLECWGESGSEWLLVLEDDVLLASNFADRFKELLSHLEASGDGEQWDLICVGSRLNMGEHVDFDEEHTVPGVMRIRNYRNCHTHAYAIRPRAASLLIAKAEEEGIICGMDWFMAIQHRRMNSFAFMPSLAGQLDAMAHPSDIAAHNAKWGTANDFHVLSESGVLG